MSRRTFEEPRKKLSFRRDLSLDPKGLTWVSFEGHESYDWDYTRHGWRNDSSKKGERVVHRCEDDGWKFEKMDGRFKVVPEREKMDGDAFVLKLDEKSWDEDLQRYTILFAYKLRHLKEDKFWLKFELMVGGGGKKEESLSSHFSAARRRSGESGKEELLSPKSGESGPPALLAPSTPLLTRSGLLDGAVSSPLLAKSGLLNPSSPLLAKKSTTGFSGLHEVKKKEVKKVFNIQILYQSRNVRGPNEDNKKAGIEEPNIIHTHHGPSWSITIDSSSSQPTKDYLQKLEVTPPGTSLYLKRFEYSLTPHRRFSKELITSSIVCLSYRQIATVKTKTTIGMHYT